MKHLTIIMENKHYSLVVQTLLLLLLRGKMIDEKSFMMTKEKKTDSN